MVVRSIGNSLMVILPDLLGKKITNWFELVRPLIAFKFQTVSETERCVFEIRGSFSLTIIDGHNQNRPRFRY